MGENGIKLVYDQWMTRFPDNYVNYMSVSDMYDKVILIERLIEEATDDLNNFSGMSGICYTGLRNTGADPIGNMYSLWNYITELHYELLYSIDEPLYQGFVNRAAHTLSYVKLEDCKVPNNLGVQKNTYNPIMDSYYVPGGGFVTYPTGGYYSTEEKKELTFDDFMGVSGSFGGVGIPAFRDLFKQDYDKYKVSDGKNMNYSEYCQMILKSGQYGHQMDKPFEQFLSGLLDILTLGIKPLIEACTGVDMITGDHLNEMQRGFKLIFAVVDLTSVIITIATVGAGAGPMAALRAVLVQMGSQTAGYLTTEICNAMELPPEVSGILGLIVGLKVYQFGSQWILADSGGKILGFVEDGQVRDVKHAVGGSQQAQSVLDGIDPKYFNDGSRFGGGFYVGEDADTIVLELAEHGTTAKYSISYDLDLAGQRVLDLTNPQTASEWEYIDKLTSTSACQKIGEAAKVKGYDVIMFNSYRGEGINYVIFDNFDILSPRIITPID